MTLRRSASALAALALLLPADASAQPRRTTPRDDDASANAPTNARARIGTEHAARLLRSSDASERLRGIERAAAIGSAEAVALLAHALDGTSPARGDSRALLAIARGLSGYADQERARTALLSLVNLPSPSGRGASARGGRADADGADAAARAELARHTAAIALSRSGGDRALELLYAAARSGGAGQTAAIAGLLVQPPRDPGFFGRSGGTLPPAVLRMLGQLGDLRALDVLHAAARSPDVDTRAAAVVSLAELGDQRAVAIARSMIVERDLRLRAAAGEAFVLLGAGERLRAVAALIADEATSTVGVRLAERVWSPEITKLVAARAKQHPDRALRSLAIRALGRTPQSEAARELMAPSILQDDGLAYEGLLALARSPAEDATHLLAALMAGPRRDFAVRAYVTRALVRGERSRTADEAIGKMAVSSAVRDRALGVFARVALGQDALDGHLRDREARVRRAAAMGALANPSCDTEKILLSRFSTETDALTLVALASGFSRGDAAAIVPTSRLLDRVTERAADAPLAAYALARRADDGLANVIGQLLAAPDPTLRAHVARGLEWAALDDVAGRLAAVYAYEIDPGVRRAIVRTLAGRVRDADAPSRRRTLELAARLDPDASVRQIARRALDGTAAVTPSPSNEVAWLRLVDDEGRAPAHSMAATVIGADGAAVPVVFDEDGHVLVAGLPPGESRLTLAPRLPSYEALAR